MWTVALAIMLAAAPPTGDYLMVFSAQSIPYRPTRAHTFAAVVQVGMAADGSPCVLNVCSLSWLPVAGAIRPFALRAEEGRNVPLDETLRDATESGRRICMWGPYLVRPEFAQSFRDRVAQVESSFRYRGACLLSPLHVCDCTRSVEEMVGRRRYIGMFGYGEASSSVVVQMFEPWLIGPSQTHPSVSTLIGLDNYEMIHRAHGDYTYSSDQRRMWIPAR